MFVARLASLNLLFIGLAAAAGCGKGLNPLTSPSAADVEAGAGNYSRSGPMGLSVETTRLGKIRMRGMMGQDGESDREVFTIRTRLKLLDAETPVKQPPLQRDGMMFGGAGLELKDDAGKVYRPVGAFGFGGATARRKDDVVLSAESPETTDLLTFESTREATGDLTLIVSGSWQAKQEDGKFLQPGRPGSFRIRIPRAMWESPLPSTPAGPGNWSTVGPVSVAAERAWVGKIPMRGIGLNPEGESQDPAFAVSLRVKLADGKARVKKPPFVSDGLPAVTGASVLLKTPKGDGFPVLAGFGLDRIVGRQQQEVELSPEKPETTDLLTFSADAAKAEELDLTLWASWKELQPDGSWADAPADGEFRFRIPKSMWVK